VKRFPSNINLNSTNSHILTSRPDLTEPHILRSLANIKITSIHTSCSGCHCICIDVDGAAWLFGRNSPAALGRAPPGAQTVPPNTMPGTVSDQAPWRLTPQMLGAPKGVTFVHAATGRGHSLIVGSNGDVWSSGTNQHGQVRSCSRNACRDAMWSVRVDYFSTA
jgi:alpha-tubulin suppressor-like RCC1 family protein